MKICGITDPGAAETAVEAGANAIGFVFADSPRRVTARDASSISRDIPSGTLTVAVFRRPSAEDVEEVLASFTPDLIQADHDALVGRGSTVTLPVFRDGDGAIPDGGRFLYEGPVSGAGRLVDLSRGATIARMGEMVLAGGLRPDNVSMAIDRVRPFGVDVSSGVESAPGVKDPALIRSFVAAARAAQERLVSR